MAKTLKLLSLLLAPLIFNLMMPSQKSYASGVDLHAHLFMKEGMTWFFKGSFFGPLQAKNWKDKLSSQANPETLNQSDLDLVVVSLYAHPLFTLSLKESVKRQIDQARQFVSQNPNWVIAKTPMDASQAIRLGKHVLVLALEGASGILNSEEDLVQLIDQEGVRIVTLLHLSDDELGGTAFLEGMKVFSSPVALFRSLFNPVRDSLGNRVNPHGLTPRGMELAKALIKRRVWIDLAHASDAAQLELFPILKEAKQPILYTHTALRKYHQAERGISLEQLQRLAAESGFIGLMPSEEMIENTPVATVCKGSVHALTAQFLETAQIVDRDSISIGSDTNGGILHLRPSCGTKTRIDQEGYWNMGQAQALREAIRTLGNLSPSTLGSENTVKFLNTWSKLWQ